MLALGLTLGGCSEWGEIDNYEILGVWELTQTTAGDQQEQLGAFVKYRNDGAGIIYRPDSNELLKRNEFVIYNVLYSLKNGILKERRECKYLNLNEILEFKVIELTPSLLILEHQEDKNYLSVSRSWYQKRDELPYFKGKKLN